MSDYQAVYRRIWIGETMRDADDATRLAVFYLLTCPSGNTEGFYRLPLVLAAHELGWSVEATREVFVALEEQGFAVFDFELDVVFVVNGLAWNPPSGIPRLKGCVNRLADLPETVLWGYFLRSAAVSAKPLLPMIAERFGRSVDNYPLVSVSPGQEPSRYRPETVSGTPCDTPSSTQTLPQTLKHPTTTSSDTQDPAAPNMVAGIVDAIRTSRPEIDSISGLSKAVTAALDAGHNPTDVIHTATADWPCEVRNPTGLAVTRLSDMSGIPAANKPALPESSTDPLERIVAEDSKPIAAINLRSRDRCTACSDSGHVYPDGDLDGGVIPCPDCAGVTS